MNKASVILASILVLAMSSVAWAIPTTWTDEIDFGSPGKLITLLSANSYTHNIADSGFSSSYMGGNDTISSYQLEISIHDDNVGTRIGRITIPDGPEIATIWTTGGVYSYNFSLSSETFSGGLLGRLDLSADGKLGVTVASLLGDFYLGSSKLTAYGDNGSAPTPIPAAAWLFGSGVLGLLAIRRRKV